MTQDPFERIQVFLSQTRVNPLALLLDLTKLLPESLLQRAIWLARNASEDALRAFLIQALAKRLPTRVERVELTKEYPVPSGAVIKEVSVPEGKEAKKLIARLSEEQRYEVFDRLLTSVERGKGGQTQEDRAKGFGDAETDSFASPSGVASIERPDGSTNLIPFDDDDGFESVGDGEPEERRDIVNLGFSRKEAADERLLDEPLQRGQSYYFYVNIGYALKEAIGAPTPIDLDKLPEEADLTVAIFGFENELAITPGQDIGELKIQKDATVKVVRQPAKKSSIRLSARAAADYLEDFLLFPISVPEKEGTYRLRCNIYCAQMLVQSYVVSARVKSTPAPIADAYAKKLDYVLSESLRAAHLASLTEEPHVLSLMINDNGDGSHSFRFFGADGTERFKDDAQIDGQQIDGFLKEARQAMHKVSWGNVDPWNPDSQLAYRYQSQTFDRKKLAKDLAFLARAGQSIYAGFVQHLKTAAAELETIMANPGLVQIALKLVPAVVVPAAVIYDYAWMPDNFDFANTEFELCPTFSAAIDAASAGGPSLEDCDCFKGGCGLKAMIVEIQDPDSDKTLADLPPMVCPSGFWGYRHSLGLPLTLDGVHKEIPPVINFKDELQMVAGVSTDPLFVERDPHLNKLKALKGTLKFEREESYSTFVKRLKKTTPHLLYFYCHGGVRANNERPYLEIGSGDRIGPESLLGERILWKGPNPLVFINGCHTTALKPEIALSFVSSFVQQSGAAGVIGTEITIFEPLAAKFAEECFGRFIGAPPHNESMPIGKAVRGARLELLKQGNPLGLVYIPYAVASLRLQETQN